MRNTSMFLLCLGGLYEPLNAYTTRAICAVTIFLMVAEADAITEALI